MTREEIMNGINHLGGHVVEDEPEFVLITKTGRLTDRTNGTAYHKITPTGVYEDCSMNVRSVGESEIRKYTRALHELMKENNNE